MSFIRALTCRFERRTRHPQSETSPQLQTGLAQDGFEVVNYTPDGIAQRVFSGFHGHLLVTIEAIPTQSAMIRGSRPNFLA